MKFGLRPLCLLLADQCWISLLHTIVSQLESGSQRGAGVEYWLCPCCNEFCHCLLEQGPATCTLTVSVVEEDFKHPTDP